MKKLLLIVLVLLISINISIADDQPKIYWGDVETDKLQRANLDGTDVETIINWIYVRDLAIDPYEKKLYWVQKGPSENNKIKRANLDGTGREQLVRGLSAPRGIDLDLLSNKMYWTVNGGGRSKIQRANLDGSNVESVLNSAYGRGIVLDLVNKKMYWTHIRGWPRPRSIQRANLDGTDKEILVNNLGTPNQIVIDKQNKKMYWTDMGLKAKPMNKIQRANLDGTNVEDIVTGLKRPLFMAILSPDHDQDGVLDSEDKCPKTNDDIISLKQGHYSDPDGDATFESEGIDSDYSLTDTYGCNCRQILDLKPGKDKGELKTGCTKATIEIFSKQIGWAKDLR